MPESNVAGLVRTVLGLRELEIRQQAQDLAVRQQGAAEKVMQTQMVAGLSDLIRSTADPKKFEVIAPVLAQQYGLDKALPPEQLAAFIQGLTPSVQVQQAGALQGARAEGTVSNTEVALSGIGQTPEGQAHGQTYLALSPEQRKKMDLIRGGLDLSAEAQANLERDWANLRIQDREAIERAALNAAQLRLQGRQLDIEQQRANTEAGRAGAADRHAGARSTASIQKEYNGLIKNYTDALVQIIQNGPTMTKGGLRAALTSLNLYGNQIIGYIGPEAAEAAGVKPFKVDEALSSYDIADFIRRKVGH